MSSDDDFYDFLKNESQLSDRTFEAYYYMFLFFKKYFLGIDHDQILDYYIDQCYKKNNESSEDMSNIYLLNLGSKGNLSAVLRKYKEFKKQKT